MSDLTACLLRLAELIDDNEPFAAARGECAIHHYLMRSKGSAAEKLSALQKVYCSLKIADERKDAERKAVVLMLLEYTKIKMARLQIEALRLASYQGL